MKMVKSLLLGSAAGLAAVVGAQAADLPVKAKPVEYVKVCSLYGAGYWYVPGTNTCLKVGSYIRYQLENEANGGLIYRNGVLGTFTRTGTPFTEHRLRGVISVDTRTQTEYGTLRGYVRVGAEQTNPVDFDQVVFFDRGFIQFAGFTIGRAESFYDFVSLARYNYVNNVTGSNMGATGQTVFGYTWQLGNGWSATLAMEDGGASAAGPNGGNSRSRGKWTVDTSTPSFALGAGPTLDNGSYEIPDFVANIRVDQAWGSAQIKAAIHENKGGYFQGGLGCPVGNANNTNCGHPDDKIGWAVGAGLAWNIPGLPGDSLSVEGNYAEGATGYTTRTLGAWRRWSDSRSIGIGFATDSVYGNPNALGYDGSLQLTTSYGVVAAAEHRWNPQWRTSIYGGVEFVQYNAQATALICASPVVNFTVRNCDPDFHWWNIGTRTQWNPHPYLDVGLDVQYLKLNTAFAGAGVVTAADGARPAGPVVIENQDWVTAMFRVQYNFLP